MTGPRSRVARVMRVLIPVAILAVILLAVGTVGFVEYSAQPGFCKGCHNMVPYYDSWTNSSHKNVPCIKCHYAPGIKAEAMGKLQAANQVVKYVTGSYGMKPWAEIEDAACLRSGCHSERKIEGTVDYNGVAFEHSKHLGELRRGKQLRCTSCHSQIVQGNHLAVTPETCFLCHFKDRPLGAPLAGCTGCHPSPPRVVSKDGYVVEHAKYVANRQSCISCHGEVTAGTGAADRARCFSCHNEPERISKFDDPPFVHQIHITDHKVECTQCHTPITHRIGTVQPTVELDCKGCHTRAHDAQRRLYAGAGGHNTESSPSKMFLARVSCLGCHEQSARLRGHERVQVAGEASCLSCHGTRYVNILPAWQKEMAERVSRVVPVVERARAALNTAAPGRRAVADSLLRMAEENLELVRLGKPAHNVTFADQLLRSSVDLVRQAVKAGGLRYDVPRLDLGPRVDETACSACHLGTERTTVPFRGGGVFPHQPHVVGAGLRCVECHTPFDKHGGTRITSRAACQDCHHSRQPPLDCAVCHKGARAAPDSSLMLASGIAFPHGTHRRAVASCGACHVPPAMSAKGLNCDNCHDQHHQPTRPCVTCHRQSDALAKHAPFAADVHAAEPPCAACHEKAVGLTSWTLQVCTACHVTKATGHHEELARSQGCQACHDLKSIGPKEP